MARAPGAGPSRRVGRFLPGAAAALIALAAPAAEPAPTAGPAAPSLRGVWRGAAGGDEIVACFNGGAAGGTGSYFHVAGYLAPAPLRRGADGALEELGTDGRVVAGWRLQAEEGDRLSGLRTNAARFEVSPVELARVAAADDDRACASDAFNRPLERPALAAGPALRFQGRRDARYRKLRFGPEESVELLGGGAALARIDAELRTDLPRGPEDLEEVFSIRRAALGRSGVAEEDEVRAEPVYWTSHLVTVLVTRRVAAEGENGLARTLRTWDLATGDRVSLWSWFAAAGKVLPDTDTGPLPAEVRGFLVASAGADAPVFKGCDLDAGLDEPWEIALEEAGLRFTLAAYPRTACEPSVLVPWGRLAPTLSPAGEAAVKRLAGGRR